MDLGSLSASSLYLSITLLMGALSLVAYIVDYDSERFDNIASKIERNRWEEVCQEFGELTSDLVIAIDDDPTVFKDILESPDETAEFAQEVFPPGSALDDLNEKISKMKKPREAANRCWIGSFASPFAYAFAVIFLIPAVIFDDPIFSPGFFIASLVSFGIAIFLTLLYGYYRVRLRQYENAEAFL